MAEYVSTKETAKLIRALLKRTFPGVKFGVRSKVYSGGSSIAVSWIDGPTVAMVDPLVSPFAGSGFDGMIDMSYGVDAYLTPDGRAVFAATSGTEGSAGMVPAGKQWMPEPGCKRVRFCADYVFTRREFSRSFLERAAASFKARYAMDEASLEIVDGYQPGTAWSKFDGPWSLEQIWRSFVAKRMPLLKAA